MDTVATQSRKRVPASGPLDADVLIVGEAPGYDEEQRGIPFIGRSGMELDRMLAEAGLSRARCRIINVTPFRPPGNDIGEFFLTKGEAKKQPHHHLCGRYFGGEIAEGLQELRAELFRHQPKMIVALGATALWALTGETAITSWRGSMMRVTPDAPINQTGVVSPVVVDCKVLPTYHPAAILRQWAWRSTAVHDLRRAASYVNREWPLPQWDFITSPTFAEAIAFLQSAIDAGKPVACDIETTGRNISLVGIATSRTRALCIPFFTNETASRSYWGAEEEYAIVSKLRELLESPNCGIIGQNFHYDAQHLLRQMGIYPHVVDDTMWMQHVLFPGTPKALDYIASLYCTEYVYWKDELKDYRALPTDEQKFRRYNCEDACRTYEIWEKLKPIIRKSGLDAPYAFQISLFNPVLDMMVRGVRVDPERRKALKGEVSNRMIELAIHFEGIVGKQVGASPKASPWYRSPAQMCTLFYNEMGMKPILHHKTQRPTVNNEALMKIGRHSPVMGLLCDWLSEYSTLNTYDSTFLAAPLDPDGRVRCSYNVAGTENFRFSSSENAFGGGLNLQNIPRDKKVNVKAMFVPDADHVILEWDLKSADLQVVIEESGAVKLREWMDKGLDVYSTLASHYYQRDISKKDPERQLFKNVTHALDYVAGPNTLAATYGLDRNAVEKIKNWYLKTAAPEIAKWHGRVMGELRSGRTVKNLCGYRRVFFDRLDNVLKDATAWLGASPVSFAINSGMLNLRRNLPWVTVLMQVHDSLVIQIPKAMFTPENLKLIEAQLLVPLPARTSNKPLIIPVEWKASDKSWGECA